MLMFIFKTVCTLDANHKNCRDRNRLIENEKGDLYTLIDATLQQKLTLQCHYWYANTLMTLNEIKHTFESICNVWS
jgi:hypothetical protein